MPIRTSGTDVALVRNARTGKYDLKRADDGNPQLTDSQEHAVLSVLIERRPSPGRPGWILDETGTRGLVSVWATSSVSFEPPFSFTRKKLRLVGELKYATAMRQA